MAGPLEGIKVVELAGLGALPFGSLKLADMGAEVVRVDRLSEVPENPEARPHNSWDRGRRSIALDLKDPRAVETVLRLAEGADAFLEAFRPGVAERLGLGPEILHARNPRLVYGRLTGWGQEGPLARVAGHSLNYEAITGATRSIGPAGGPPVPTLTLLGDFAGGGLHLAYGVVCALLEAQRSGRGQVVDAAMVDGVSALMGVFHGMDAMGMSSEELGTNLFDGGAPFYNVYETSDGRYVSVAPMEPHFYALLLEKIGLDPAQLPDQYDEAHWPEMRERLAEVFRTKTRDEWSELLEGSDACYAPVLTLSEARAYPHNRARGMFMPDREAPELVPTPRLSRTPGEPGDSPAWIGADTDAILGEAGFSAEEVAELREAGTIR